MAYSTMSEFEYLLPRTIEEAVSYASEHKDAKMLFGGTDLMILINRRIITPGYVIDLSRVKGFGALEYDAKTGLRMGAGCTLRTIENSEAVKENYPVLVDAMKVIASVQIRNMASIGGNLCNASPAADTAPPLLVLGAEVTIVGKQGERSMPLESFFLGPRKTALQPGEILKEVRIPPSPPDTGASFVKIGRTPTDISKVGVAVLLTMKGKVCQEIRIALGSVGPTPMRAKKAEEALRGKEVTPELVEKVASLASDEAKPITDIRSTAVWRKRVTGHLVKSLLTDNYRRLS